MIVQSTFTAMRLELEKQTADILISLKQEARKINNKTIAQFLTSIVK
jgi:hypothetical protein